MRYENAAGFHRFGFFRQRAGMFLVLLGVLFGFLSANEHHAFAVFFLTGTYGMLALFVIWLIYSLLCAQFLINTWKLPEYTFIYHARMWPAQLRMRRFAIQALGFAAYSILRHLPAHHRHSG